MNNAQTHHRMSTHRSNLRNGQKGMTLLEIMIVVAILGLLATVVVTNLMGTLDNAKIGTTQTKIASVEQAIQMYYTQVSEYPDSLKDLINPPGGFKPYVKSMPKDSWKKELIYKRSSGDKPFVVYSVGPDGSKGTKDDIYPQGYKAK
jgi:general secretion pathway protein G